MLIGVCNKLLGDHVQNRKSVLDNGVQLLVKTLLNDVWQRVAVSLLSSLPCDSGKLLLGIIHAWGECSRRNGSDIRIDHIRYLVCIGNNDLVSLFLAQVGKFLQHFISRPEIQRRLIFGIGKLVVHKYLSEYRVRRVHKMNVAGGNNGYVQRLTQLNDRFVELLQILNGVDVLVILITDKELVVEGRLYLQIIVK